VLLSAFGVLALLLAIVGIYGVIAYSVSQRTREFGIRIAVGAAAADVIRLVLREAGWRVVIGIAGGTVIALALLSVAGAFLHEYVLYNVGTADPATYLSVAAVLIGVALAPCYIPAKRAAQVDAMRSLRYE
jgi:ABC-type antimicrobial peptide transport system permease subunit